MHGPVNVKFVDAKQAKKHINIGTSKSAILNKIDTLVYLVGFTIGILCIL